MKPLETIPVSHIRRIREWEDGLDELESISHSFALELQGMRDPWCMFSDSGEDKVREEVRLRSLRFDLVPLYRRTYWRF